MTSKSESPVFKPFSISCPLQDKTIEWNNSKKHPIIGAIGARFTACTFGPPLRAFDAVINTILGLGKILVGVTITGPISFCAYLVRGKGLNTQWTVKNGLFHIGHGIIFAANIFLCIPANLISPNIYAAKKTNAVKEQILPAKISDTPPQPKEEPTQGEPSNSSTTEKPANSVKTHSQTHLPDEQQSTEADSNESSSSVNEETSSPQKTETNSSESDHSSSPVEEKVDTSRATTPPSLVETSEQATKSAPVEVTVVSKEEKKPAKILATASTLTPGTKTNLQKDLSEALQKKAQKTNALASQSIPVTEEPVASNTIIEEKDIQVITLEDKSVSSVEDKPVSSVVEEEKPARLQEKISVLPKDPSPPSTPQANSETEENSSVSSLGLQRANAALSEALNSEDLSSELPPMTTYAWPDADTKTFETRLFLSWAVSVFNNLKLQATGLEILKEKFESFCQNTNEDDLKWIKEAKSVLRLDNPDRRRIEDINNKSTQKQSGSKEIRACAQSPLADYSNLSSPGRLANLTAKTLGMNSFISEISKCRFKERLNFTSFVNQLLKAKEAQLNRSAAYLEGEFAKVPQESVSVAAIGLNSSTWVGIADSFPAEMSSAKGVLGEVKPIASVAAKDQQRSQRRGNKQQSKLPEANMMGGGFSTPPKGTGKVRTNAVFGQASLNVDDWLNP